MNEFPRNLLAIQAHPDDAEAWCAGTLKLLSDMGWRVTIATVTGGGMGGLGMDEAETVRVRAAEAEHAAELLGATYHSFGRRDGYLFDDEAIRIEVVSLIRRVGAGVVMTHVPFDYHQDHRATAQIADAACMIASLPNVPSDESPLEVTPLLYHTMPLNMSDALGEPVPKPHFYVDITGPPMETKMAMLDCHESQKELMRHMHKIDDFMGVMQVRSREAGMAIGTEFAECYWQHLGGGYQKDPLIQTELADYVHTEQETE